MPTSSGQHLVKLVQLAHETSSEKRRELLRDLTNLFIEEPAAREGGAGEDAGHILARLAADMEESVRAELAARFADADQAPKALVHQLARDAIAVARPLLERSLHLDQDALVAVAQEQGQEHLRAIAQRGDVGAALADAIVARGDDATLATLAGNAKAELSREAMEAMVERAENCAALHDPLVARPDLSPDLLNEMFAFVGERLRAEIIARNETLDPAQLDAALTAARARMARKAKAAPADFDDAVRFIQMKKLRRQLDGALLVSLLTERKLTHFTVGLADLSGLDYAAARRATENPAVDPLAIACRLAGLDVDDFVGVALLRPTRSARESADAEALGHLYAALPQDAVERVMRFWRVRTDSNAKTTEV